MKQQLQRIFNRQLLLPWTALLLGLSVLLLVLHFDYVREVGVNEKRFERHVQQINQLIEIEMRNHEAVLLGVAALFDASKQVDREEFRRYIKRLGLTESEGSGRGIGYIELIAPSELLAHTLAVRHQGFPQYSVHPAGVRKLYSSVVFIEPSHAVNLKALGFDPMTETIRAQAIRRAGETGLSTLTGRIVRANETEKNPPATFAMFVPVYRKNQALSDEKTRWSALQGLVASAFNITELMRAIKLDSDLPVDVMIFDDAAQTSTALFFDSTALRSPKARGSKTPQFSTSLSTSLYNSNWTIRFRSQSALEVPWLSRPRATALALGLSLTSLLFWIGLLLLRRHSDTETLAKKLTQNLNQRTQELKKMQFSVDHSNDSILWIDPDGNILYANDSACKERGYSHQEMRAQTVYALNPDFPLGRWPVYFEELKQKGSLTWETRHLTKQGKVFPIEVSANFVVFEGQEFNFSSIRNITDRKALEEKSAALLQQSQALATDLETTNQQLKQTLRFKSDFLANMSHEIRTPMNAIIGFSYLALKTELDAVQKNYVQKIETAAKHLLNILNDILDNSKIEAGKLELEETDLNLEQVLEHLSDIVSVKADEKGLELVFEIAPDLPLNLLGDPLRLGQILLNLCNNAIKFTAQGTIQIKVEKIPEKPTTREAIALQFTVSDSGIGMTTEQCDGLFQPFSQADSSITRKYGGSGLGLSIAKSLVELMGGRIWAESTPGQGSNFYFTAWLKDGNNHTNRNGLRRQRAIRAEEMRGQRVLLVDDSPPALALLSGLLQGFGLDVATASSGEQALHLLQATHQTGSSTRGTPPTQPSIPQPYDLVLMDWVMPGLDGVETLYRLQHMDLPQPPAIVMVTAYKAEDLRQLLAQRQVQVATILPKPVSPSSLFNALSAVMLTDNKAMVETAAKTTAVNAQVTLQLSGKRVLVAEDNEMNQTLVNALLRQVGMNVVLANDGQQALDLLAQGPAFAVVLMDCHMPVMDGYQATHKIRQNPAWAKLPIIALTADAMKGTREKVLACGMNDYLTKPLDVTQLYAMLEHWTGILELGSDPNLP